MSRGPELSGPRATTDIGEAAIAVVGTDERWAEILEVHDYTVIAVAPRGGSSVVVSIEWDELPSDWDEPRLPPMAACEPGGSEGPATGMDFLVDMENAEVLALSPRWGDVSCLGDP